MNVKKRMTEWKKAPRPNYITNVDREFPYSEVPDLGHYNLVKIPDEPSQLIDHVDYWGEGRIVCQQGVSGFPDCYNVNHTFQLVSNGPDKGKKIPNRIPSPGYDDCDTSPYIRDDSVVTVTVMGSPIIKNCAVDIARMVNKDSGKVIVYGYEEDSQEVKNLTTALKDKSLFLYTEYKVPSEFQGLTLFDNHVTFLNVTLLKDEIYKLIINGNYDEAVNLTKKLDNERNGESINDIVSKLMNSNSTANFKLMSFGYKLWNNGALNIVQDHFPNPFKLILGKEKVTILNYGYSQALKLNENLSQNNDRQAWGHNGNKTSSGVSWQFIPVWLNNDVTFKLYNVDRDMYLKLDESVDTNGDRKGWGSKVSSEGSHRYFVEPYMKGGSLLFFIINYQYHQGLKLGTDVDSHGDRVLLGHNGDIYEGEDRFKWSVAAWSPSK